MIWDSDSSSLSSFNRSTLVKLELSIDPNAKIWSVLCIVLSPEVVCKVCGCKVWNGMQCVYCIHYLHTHHDTRTRWLVSKSPLMYVICYLILLDWISWQCLINLYLIICWLDQSKPRGDGDLLTLDWHWPKNRIPGIGIFSHKLRSVVSNNQCRRLRCNFNRLAFVET